MHVLFALGAIASSAEPADDPAEIVEPYVTQGDFEGALRVVENAIEVDPDDIELIVLAAKLAVAIDSWARSVTLLERALELDPNDDEARAALARGYAELGDDEAARQTNAVLLQRQPNSSDGAAIAERLESTDRFQITPFGRAEVATGYDSNPTLLDETGGTVGDTDAPGAAFLVLDGVVGITERRREHRFTLLGRVRSQLPLGVSDEDDPAVANALPSSLSATAIGRLRLAPDWLAAIDLRYQALFVDGFDTWVQHFVAPSGFITWSLGRHELRLLAGAELRALNDERNGVPAANDSLAPRLALRDSVVFGPLLLVGDVGLRLNVDLDEDDDPTSRFVGYTEFSALVYAQYALTESLQGLVGFDGRTRGFDDFGGESDRENVGQAFVGLRYRLDSLEFHAEYGLTRSSGAREFERQIVSGGVRLWY
ncbi:MAG: tetratricopeptide repeat protein [Myxococcota bacterium]